MESRLRFQCPAVEVPVGHRPNHTFPPEEESKGFNDGGLARLIRAQEDGMGGQDDTSVSDTSESDQLDLANSHGPSVAIRCLPLDHPQSSHACPRSSAGPSLVTPKLEREEMDAVCFKCTRDSKIRRVLFIVPSRRLCRSYFRTIAWRSRGRPVGGLRPPSSATWPQLSEPCLSTNRMTVCSW